MKIKLFPLVSFATILAWQTPALCQNVVELNSAYKKTVPEGKIWYLPNSQSQMMTLSDGTFQLGTACNSAINSNPRYLIGILSYSPLAFDERIPELYGFTVKETPVRIYENVYYIKPYYLAKNLFDETILKNSLTWQYRNDELVFYPGTKLQTLNCIRSLTILERNITSKDKANFAILKQQIAVEQNKINQEQLAIAQAKYKEQQENYNDKAFTYQLNGISNASQIFSGKNFDTACIGIGRILQRELKGDYACYHKMAETNELVKVIVRTKWDSTGKVVSTKTNSTFHSNKIHIDSLLTLSCPPTVHVTFTRKCFLENDLTFTLRLSEKGFQTYYIKRTKKGFKFVDNKQPEIEHYILTQVSDKLLDDNSLYQITQRNIFMDVRFYPYHYLESDSENAHNKILMPVACFEIDKITRQQLSSRQFKQF